MANDTDSPDTSSVTMRIPDHLRVRLEEAAASEDRPLSSFIRFHVTRLLDERDAAAATTNTSEEV